MVAGRRRLISFRLTDEEYDRLRSLSAECGSRSLSDFVRSCVCTMLEADSAWDQRLDYSVREFGQRAAGLQTLVEEMSQLFRNAQFSQKRIG
jgi:hypothetical protein